MHAAALVTAALGLWLAAPPAPGRPAPVQDAEAGPRKPYRVGTELGEAFEIELEDLGGGKRRLVSENEDHHLVLVFWALRDPVARGYVPRLEELARSYAAEKVKLVLVAANHDEIFPRPGRDPLKAYREYAEKEELALDLLIDHGNRLADDFGALTSSHTFVIDAKRVLRYAGAIDEAPPSRKPVPGHEPRSFLREALDAVLKGTSPESTVTRPHGRKIQRAPKPPKAR